MDSERAIIEMSTDQDIADFLRDASEPRDRALVAVLMQINRNWKELADDFTSHRTEFIDHRKDFNNHVMEERNLFQQGHGMYRALTWAISVGGTLVVLIGMLGAYIGSQYVGMIAQAVLSDKEHEKRLIVVETQHMEMLKKIDYIEAYVRAK